MMKRRRHSAETKEKAVLEALREDVTLAEVAAKYEIHPKLLGQWKQEFLENASTVFNRKKHEKQLEESLKEKDETIDSLYKEVGLLTLKVNWAEKKLGNLSFETKRQMVNPEDNLSVKNQCQMLSLSRSAHYYQSQKKEVSLELKRALCDLYEGCPFYGYRKTVHELRSKGFNVGKKLVRKLKRELGLKTMYPEPKTSIPNKAHKKYPYLLRGVEITHVNQVWSADISYIPMGKSFVYILGSIDLCPFEGIGIAAKFCLTGSLSLRC